MTWAIRHLADGMRLPFVEAGTLEVPFPTAARAYAAITRRAGNPTQLEVRVGGHDAALWRDVFPNGVAFTLNR